MSATAGGAGFTLTVNGSNFAAGPTVLWNNPENPNSGQGSAAFVSSTQLTKPISSSDIEIPGSVQVTVMVGNGSGPSNPATFVINPGPPGVLQKPISIAADGTAPNKNSHDPVLSFNGRYVAFSSEATNLIVPNAKFPEGYVRDTCLGAQNCKPLTLLVSAETGGSASSPVEGNGMGGATPSMGFQTFSPPSGGTAAGRFIGFLSTATNLIAGGTIFQQAYFRDDCVPDLSGAGCNPATLLVSLTESGGEPNGPATEFVLSNNNCNAAFASAATDVMSGVTIPNEVYLSTCGIVAPFAFGFTTSALVSADNVGAPANQGAQQPAISADGRFVAFTSTSTNLPGAPGGGLGAQNVFLRDTCTLAAAGCAPSTILVSVDSAGNPIAGNSQHPAISNDGRFVVFNTAEPLLGGGVTNIVSIHDTCNSSSGAVANCSPSTETISVAAGGGAANGSSNSRPHAVSGDGRLVVFDSTATNLVTPATSGNQVFVRDTCRSSSGRVSNCTPQTVLISVNKGNLTGGFNAAISDDGHFAAFENQTSISQIMLAATGF
jgi:hypothetical protein